MNQCSPSLDQPCPISPLARLLVIGFCLAGCGAPAPPPDDPLALPAAPVTRLAGELHLHQFPLGAHAWAAFLEFPIDAHSVHNDQLVELDTAPAATDGTCTLYPRPDCTPACPGDNYCSANQKCSPIPLFQYIDGGPLTITGSRLAPTIRLWFASEASGYGADPPPGLAPLFQGGETLSVRGGTGPTQLRGTLNAPRPVQLIAPDPAADLHLPRAAFSVRWTPENAALMVLTISASHDDGSYAWIRCVTADTGTLDVPASLMNALPPPPRAIRIELERDDERVLKTITPGLGILAHAAFSAWKNGTD